MLIRDYANVKYPSKSESAVVNQVTDIEVISDDEGLNSAESKGRMELSGEIICVHRVDEYSTCKGKVNSINGIIGV